MILEITQVQNASTAEGEYAELIAHADLNLKGYALVDSTFDEDGEPSNEFRHIFIFPDLAIAAGEAVWVHTGEGSYSKSVPSPAERGEYRTTHHLYWNSKAPVWNDKTGDNALLIKFYIKDRCMVPPVKRRTIRFN